MKKLWNKGKGIWNRGKNAVNAFVCNRRGDQMTGWLICILLVVIVGAAFIAIYNQEILILWNLITTKMKNMFSL